MSVVPLDIEELRDSVVLGRFRAVSSLVRGEAAGGPEGLGAGGGARKQEAIEITGIKNKYKTRGKLLRLQMLMLLDFYSIQAEYFLLLYSLYAVFGGSVALVKLIGVIEFVLTGGVGEVWHRV